MPVVKLDRNEKAVILSGSVSNELVYEYFDSLADEKRDDAFSKVLHIGVMAVMEDRIAAFLSSTKSELGAQLEALKRLYEIKQAKANTAQSGTEAEFDIYRTIVEYFELRKFSSDNVQLTGSSGGVLNEGRRLNKTGDIVIEVEGDETRRIVIESKFNKQISLGAFGKTSSGEKTADTAISQMIESMANRDAKIAIIVFDKERISPKLEKEVGNIRWEPDLGFIVAIDHSRADYSNLYIALDLARSLVNSTLKIEDQSIFESLLSRMANDISKILETERLLRENHENLAKIAKSIREHALLVKFTKELLEKFVSTGSVSREDLLKIYRGDEISSELKGIAKEVEQLFPFLA